MDLRSAARKGGLWVLGALGAGPMIAEAIKRWADRNGYLDNPSDGVQWLMTKIAAVTEYRFFYPAVFFLVGLAVGLWVDALLKGRGGAKETALVLLGYDLRQFSDLIMERAERSLENWPRSIGDRGPDLQALLNRAEAPGFLFLHRRS